MIDRDVALEALCALCQSSVTSTKKQALFRSSADDGARQLSTNNFIFTILHADETCPVSQSNFIRFRSALQGGVSAAAPHRVNQVDIGAATNTKHIIDEDEFFDPRFDYDFTNLRDTETYRRGGEVYERPSGWQRFALKILNKYEDNKWLGTRYRSTSSVPGEWPVSYHGTSKQGADGIIEGFYKPGSGQVYGRGIYSTPYMKDAIQYAKTFTSKKTGKTYRVVLQNRINPEYREKHRNGSYYLIPIPKGTCPTEEQRMVERAIRPYGLLLQEV